MRVRYTNDVPITKASSQEGKCSLAVSQCYRLKLVLYWPNARFKREADGLALDTNPLGKMLEQGFLEVAPAEPPPVPFPYGAPVLRGMGETVAVLNITTGLEDVSTAFAPPTPVSDGPAVCL